MNAFSKQTVQRQHLAALLAAVSITALTTTAYAQTATTSDGASSLSEVIVTTRSRQEKLQDVPLAVTNISGQTLQQTGVAKLSDVAALTAGILIPKSSTESGGSGVIRGIVDLSGTGTPTVSTFFNGVYLGNPTAVSIGMMDTQRIEIVKGPVTALYGRGGFSGAINYVLASPPPKFGGHIMGQVGNGGERAVSGSVGGPIVKDMLTVGFAGSYDKFDGTYQDAVNGLKIGGHEKKDGRISLDFTPTSKLHIWGGLYYGNDFFSAQPAVHTANNCGTYNAAAATPGGQYSYTCGQITGLPLEVANISGAANQTGNGRKVTIGDYHASYDLGLADLSFTGGYSKVVQVGFADFTSFRNGIPFPLSPSGATVNLFELFGSNNNTEDQSYEVRLASKQDQRIRWATGYYYSKEQGSTSTLIGLDGSKIPPGQSINATANLFVTSNGQFSTSNYTFVNNTDKQYSPFAAADFDILSNLTASGEVRYTEQDKTQDILHNSFIANTLRPYGAAGTTAASFYYTNYRVSLKYKVTPDTNLYISEATGEKAGGFNTRATIVSEISYAPETNQTFEAGVKTSLLEHKLQINAAYFHIDDNGLQVSGPSDDPKNVGTVTKNFGNLTSQGVELEALGILDKHVTVSGAVAYTDPKFNSGAYNFSPGTCSTVPSCVPRETTITTAQGPRLVEKLQGLQAPFTSKLLVNGGVNIHGTIYNNVDWYTRLDYRYESKRYTTVDNLNYVGSRNNIDLNAGLTKGPVTLSFYCTNCNNDQTPITAFPNTRLNDFGVTWVAGLPDARQYGARIRYDF